MIEDESKMIDEKSKNNEAYQRLIGKLVLDEDFRKQVLRGDDETRANALGTLFSNDTKAQAEVAAYLKYRGREIGKLLDDLQDDVSFMA